jgi:mandelate racemase
MEIEQVTVRGVSLTPTRPVQTAAGTLGTTPLVLLDIDTGTAVGHAYLRPYLPAALGPLVDLTANLAQLVVGSSAEPATVARRLAGHTALLGRRGLVGAALAGIDMALWDALARTAGLPLVRLLGGQPRPIPAYLGLRSMEPAAAAKEAGQAVQAGFNAVKLKLGRGSLADDLQAVRAVRAAVGDAVAVMVDYNQSLTGPEALARARALDEHGLAWLEEPVDAEDHSGQSLVAAAARTPVQVGENWLGLADVRASIAAGASDLATLDIMRIGGVTGWLGAATLAGSAGLPVSSHAFPEYSAPMLAVTPTAHWLEYVDHAGELLDPPLSIVDGQAVIDERAGAGVNWNEQRLAEPGLIVHYRQTSRT